MCCSTRRASAYVCVNERERQTESVRYRECVSDFLVLSELRTSERTANFIVVCTYEQLTLYFYSFWNE